VTDHATESVERVGDNRVLAEWLLGNIGETGFIQSQVTRRAAVDNAEFREPDLMDAGYEPAAQADGISAIAVSER